ncbi:MAG: nitrogenase [Candidatus Methanoplasma sp.]|nr:nitrogenase [Candidatus Methanoplasma sp.]
MIEEKNSVNLNINPCKMCMPMGSATAMYGIKGCMTILHGSQGCSTYIRRHMATHYNEPIDIGSSSLTEEGTVMGGENNLIKGLDNMIHLYRPEVVGIATTCLAETIGEDVPRIIRDYMSDHPGLGVTIIPISSAGYSGTQFEGYFKALRSVVENVEMDNTPNGMVNIIMGPASPADVRYLKTMFREMGLSVIMLPDISDNLDGGHADIYSKIPEKGTPIGLIKKMAGALTTIEISSFVPDDLSPAAYLKKKYGVPFVRVNLPAGLRDTDALISELESAGGKITPLLEEQRSRLLDAMVDSHKYNADGRAAVFGEPDFVYSVSRLMTENGIIPTIAATGSRSKVFVQRVSEEIENIRDNKLVMDHVVFDSADFKTIEDLIVEKGVDVMVGSSDGRRIEDKHNIPLIRSAFPIHDHVGGQRQRMLGYDGCLELLDRITNSLITKVETSFRHELYEKYYLWDNGMSVGREDEIFGRVPEYDGGEVSVAPSAYTAPAEDIVTYTVAVSSKSGMLVDTHFGHAGDFYIYECGKSGIRFKEHRSVGKDDASSCCGGGNKGLKPGRIKDIIATVEDCDAVLSMRIGESPRSKLEALGIRCFTAHGRIEEETSKVAEIIGRDDEI